MRKSALSLALLSVLGLPAAAQEGTQGDLNPPEMSLERVLRDVERGETSMTHCASGYFLTKSGDHAGARAVFGLCAERGWTGAMTWMSQLDDNGLGGPEDPAAAAEWNRRVWAMRSGCSARAMIGAKSPPMPTRRGTCRRVEGPVSAFPATKVQWRV